MKYGNLHFLWFLWLIPIMVIFYIWAFKRKAHLINKFVSPKLKERLLQGVSYPRQKFKALLLLLVLLFAVLSLIRPKWGYHWEEVQRRGVDILIALDVSKSMLAQDVSPNRLERAKREIIDLLRIMEGDRVGLMAFAGTSFLQSPLTLDYGAVSIFLDDLDSDLIPVPGTAIGQVIDNAIKSYSTEDKKSRVLILITDGEDHAGKPIEAAKRAAEQKIKIYTIGIGKDGGAPIPDEGGGFKKDRSGELIMSKLDEDTLQKIALNTGGSYVRSVSGDLDLEKIYGDIRKNVEDKELKSGRRKRFEERFQWPLLIAILLLFFELIFSERKSLRTLLLLPLLFVSFDTSAGLTTSATKDAEDFYKKGEYSQALKELVDAQIEDPSNFQLKYNLGNTYYKMQDYQNAEKLFQSTAINGDNDLAQKSYYNLGNVAFRTGKLQEAIEHYKKALELNPNDQDAKFNLEFVREEIKKRIEENKKRQQQQQDQQKQDQQKQDQQKQDQQKQDQQKQDQQKQDQQKQDQQKQDQQKQDQQQQDQQKQDQQKQDQQKQDQQKEQNDKDKKDQQAEGQQAQDSDKKMSKEEAERWLSTMDEDRKKQIKKKMQGQGRYQVDKDW